MSGTGAVQLFERLVGDVAARKGAADVTAWLEQQGVAGPVAQMVGNAIADPGTVALPAGTTVSLGDAIAPFLPAGVTLPTTWASTTITSLSFTVAAAGTPMSFAGAVSVPLAFANQVTSLDVTLSLAWASTATGSTITGSLGGSLPLGGQQLDAVMDLQTSTAGQVAGLHCSWKATGAETISLTGLCDSFGVVAPDSKQIKDPPNPGLTEVDLILDVDTAAGQKVEIVGAYGDGEAFVVVDHVTLPDTSSQWVLVLGAQLDDKLAKWPIVGHDLAALDLDLAGGGMLLVSTADYTGLAIPPLGDGTTPFGPFPVNVTDRFMATGVLDLGSATGPAQNVGAIDGQQSRPSDAPSGHLLVTVTLPTPTLTATLGERNLFGLFPLVDLSLTVAVSPPRFTLAGEVTLHFAGKGQTNPSDLTFTAALTVTDESVTGWLDMKDTVPLVLPLADVTQVNIGELGGMMGIDFDKQEVIAGFMATFGFGTSAPTGGPPDPSGFSSMLPNTDGSGGDGKPVRPTQDQCALVLGINDDLVVLPIPDLDLLLLSVADADLTDILATVVPGVSTAEMQALLGDIAVHNLLLYWCDEPPGGLVLPDGTLVQPGFQFHGGLDVWGKFQAWAELKVTTAGFTGDATMSPISLGHVLTLAGTGDVTPDSDAAAAGVQPGGPLLHVSTQASPYLDINWDATLFGTASTTGNIVVAKDSFTFDLTTSVPGIDGALDCEITNGWTHLTAAFALSIDGTIVIPAIIVDVQLPSITLDDACDLHLTLDVSQGFELSIDGTLTFEGDTLTIPTLHLDESFTNLEDLPATMLKHIEEEAETIFGAGLHDAENLIVTYGDNALKFLDEVADDVKNFVKWVLGIHSTHKPAWLRNGAIVQGGAYSDVIQHSKRRHIPDPETLNQLVAQFGAANDVGSIVLSSIPQDDVQMPSRKNGTVITRKDDGAQFLIIDDTNKAGGVIGASYKLQDMAAFQTAMSTVSNPATYQPNPPPSSHDDIDDIPVHSQLKPACCIGVTQGGELDAFVDGIRYPIPDMPTKALLRSDFTDTHWVLQDAWNAIPIGPTLPALAVGNVVKAASDGTVYLVQSDNQLHTFQNWDSFTAWGYTADQIITIDDSVLPLLNVGHHLPKKPG